VLPQRAVRVGEGDVRFCPADQQRVGPARHPDGPLERFERHKSVVGRHLVRVEAEASIIGLGYDGFNRQAQRDRGVLDGRKRRVARQQAGLVHAQQHVVADADGKRAG
jgi:hypothetical protein